MDKPALLVICGPTGSGKTALALRLARRYPLEIISADSRQVYRFMDIGTAKATAKEQAAVPHHLIDLIDPDQEFSVAEFVDLARPLIKDIGARGRLPCVVGGTGLYIKALIGGLAELPGGDDALRRDLHQREIDLGEGTLHRELQQLDPESAAVIHPGNLIRIVRALEVVILSGEKLSQLKARHGFSQQPYNVVQLAPAWSRDELYTRIDLRAQQMLDQGLVDEVVELLSRYPDNLKAFETLGYREVINHLKGALSAEQMLEDIRKYTRRYAKRQLTWFRREEGIIWVDSSDESGKVIQSIDNLMPAR